MQSAEQKPVVSHQSEPRKAERPWIRFSQTKDDLTQTEKETQVSLC